MKIKLLYLGLLVGFTMVIQLKASQTSNLFVNPDDPTWRPGVLTTNRLMEVKHGPVM